MEVLAGARSDGRASDLRRLLLRLIWLRFEAPVDFESAARIYRRCRANGVTPRGMVDCMIAAVAWRHEATLLAADADLARIAGVIGIELDGASSSA
jgi:predicted nucleic acid-binding protein